MKGILSEMFNVRLDEAEGDAPGASNTGEAPASAPPGKPAAPKASGGAQVSGDKETLGALMEALQEAEHANGIDPDVASWCGKAWKAVAAGIRGTGTISLPRFEQTPDDLMPDEGGDEGDF